VYSTKKVGISPLRVLPLGCLGLAWVPRQSFRYWSLFLLPLLLPAAAAADADAAEWLCKQLIVIGLSMSVFRGAGNTWQPGTVSVDHMIGMVFSA